MFNTKKTLAVLVSSLFAGQGVQAQFGGLSSSCQSTAAGFLLGDLGSCLSLTTLVPVFTGSGSVIAPLDNYLGGVCTNSACSNATLSSANQSITTNCQDDLNSGNTLVTGLRTIVEEYPVVREVACLQATGNNTRCIIQTLYAVQNATGSPITVDYLTSLLTGQNSTALTQITNLDASVLCTDCTKAMYLVAARNNNSTFTSGAIARAINSKCGSGFTTSTFPSDVNNPASSTMGSATGSATAQATSSSGAGMKSFEALNGGVVLGFGMTLMGVLAGAAALLG